MSKRFALRPRGEIREGDFTDAIGKVCGASTQTLRVNYQLIRVIFHSSISYVSLRAAACPRSFFPGQPDRLFTCLTRMQRVSF